MLGQEPPKHGDDFQRLRGGLPSGAVSPPSAQPSQQQQLPWPPLPLDDGTDIWSRLMATPYSNDLKETAIAMMRPDPLERPTAQALLGSPMFQMNAGVVEGVRAVTDAAAAKQELHELQQQVIAGQDGIALGDSQSRSPPAFDDNNVPKTPSCHRPSTGGMLGFGGATDRLRGQQLHTPCQNVVPPEEGESPVVSGRTLAPGAASMRNRIGSVAVAASSSSAHQPPHQPSSSHQLLEDPLVSQAQYISTCLEVARYRMRRAFIEHDVRAAAHAESMLHDARGASIPFSTTARSCGGIYSQSQTALPGGIVGGGAAAMSNSQHMLAMHNNGAMLASQDLGDAASLLPAAQTPRNALPTSVAAMEPPQRRKTKDV
jgi:hypothetical protein